jgi:hypothetical protein
MEISPWDDDVRYIEFTPATIHYELELDAFFIARADIRSPAHPHQLRLLVAVTIGDLTENRLSMDEAIALGRVLLERLVEAHRDDVHRLEGAAVWVFDFAGIRLR